MLPPPTLATLTAIVSALTAVVGTFVAYLAYRGYRRNGSRRMRALALGIVCIAVVPYVVSNAAGSIAGVTDATAIVAITLSHTVGLAAIYTTFDR
jgi:lipopolysaccharide export LptBFGC system permease protein LptF